MASVFHYDAEMPERRTWARVTRVEQVGDGVRARHSIEFDAIDVDTDVEAAFFDDTVYAPFSAIRVVTTLRKFSEYSGSEPVVGSWYELAIGPKKTRAGPIVFYSQLSEVGYVEQARGSLWAASFVSSDDGPRPRRSLGAAGSTTFVGLQQVLAACNFPAGAVATAREIRALLSSLPAASAIVVRDVGQASFISLLGSDSRPLLHYDAGWPIVFNGRTAPKHFSPPYARIPIVLSHWDFDHMLGFWRFPHLRECQWVVPVQKLGPGARKICQILLSANRIKGFLGPSMKLPWGTVRTCTGPKVDNNLSGLALSVKLPGDKTALLVGDASYDVVPFGGGNWDFLVVTHHGANFHGTAPTPSQRGCVAAVSVGKGNVYKHPKIGAINLHRSAGWKTKTTSGDGSATRSAVHLR